MRDTLKMMAVLTGVGFVSGLFLVLVFQYASPLITDNLRKETESAIYRIFPAAKGYSKGQVNGEAVFKVTGPDGKLLGYAFVAEGYGYQGKIKMMAGIKPDLETLIGIEILDSQETPGLGQEITGDKFKSQFKGLRASPEITCVKNKSREKPNEIEAITGATISSRSAVSILNDSIARMRGDASGKQ